MIQRNDDGTYPSYAWPGGYPIFYMVKDNGVLCPDCANGKNGSEASNPECQDDPQWKIVAQDINWEDANLTCDHCNRRIESAYAEEVE